MSNKGLFSLLPRDVFDIILKECDLNAMLKLRACSKDLKTDLHRKDWWWAERHHFDADCVINLHAVTAYHSAPYKMGNVKRKYKSTIGKLGRRKVALERIETDVEELNNMKNHPQLVKQSLKIVNGKLQRRKAARERADSDIKCLEEDKIHYQNKKAKLEETVRIYELHRDDYKVHYCNPLEAFII